MPKKRDQVAMGTEEGPSSLLVHMCLSQGTQMRRLDGSQTHTTLTPGQYAAVIYSSDLKDTSGNINLNS